MNNNELLNSSLSKVDLDDLTSKIVPDKLERLYDGKFKKVIRSFLEEIWSDISLLDGDMKSLVDVENLSDIEILKIYNKTYLSVFKLDEESESTILSTKDLFKVIGDLVPLKGSAFLIILLSNLLVTLIPSVKSSTKNLQDMLTSSKLITDEERLAIESNLRTLKLMYTKESILEVIEDEEFVFKYKVNGELDFVSWNKFVKPFAHPAGWDCRFENNVITLFKIHLIDSKEWFIIDELYDFKQHPYLKVNGGRSAYITDYTEAEIRANFPSHKIGKDALGFYYKYGSVVTQYSNNGYYGLDVRDIYTTDDEMDDIILTKSDLSANLTVVKYNQSDKEVKTYIRETTVPGGFTSHSKTPKVGVNAIAGGVVFAGGDDNHLRSIRRIMIREVL